MTDNTAQSQYYVLNTHEEVGAAEVPKFCPECGQKVKQLTTDIAYDPVTGEPINYVQLVCPVHGCLYNTHNDRGFFTFTCNYCGRKEKNEGTYE